ncbi:MAG: hypothetical protein J0H74_03115 [Chitinophagaceae bacterium]|nr:hypothetical protein [Chitinophagaceae bacterium]
MSIHNYKKYIPVAVALAGFLFDVLAFYPGFMSPDTFDQYNQSLHFHYTDWHPPVMAAFWSLLNFIHRGPQLMFIFQLILLWSSFYFLASSWFSGRKSFLLLLFVVFLAPYVQNFAGYIIKDAQMALSWLLGVSIILYAGYGKRRMVWWEAALSLILIFYGFAVRINAFPGAIPLYFLWVRNMAGQRKTYVQYGWTICLLTTGMLLQAFLNTAVFKPEKTYPEYKALLFDIAGIQVATGKSYYPEFITRYKDFDSGYILQHYNTATFDNIWWNPEQKKLFPDLNKEKRALVIKSWKEAIVHHPGAYLRNRFDGFLCYLRIKKRPGVAFFYYFYPLIYPNPNPYGFVFNKNILTRGSLRIFEYQRYMPYMEPWFWALLSVVLLFLITRLPGSSPVKVSCFCIVASAFLYLAPQFFIFQIDTDFRYFYWMCIANALPAALLLRDRI